VIREDNARTVEYTFAAKPFHFVIPGFDNTTADYAGTGVVAAGSLPGGGTPVTTVGFDGGSLAVALANAKAWMNMQISDGTAGFSNMESVDVDAGGTKLIVNYRSATGTATNEIAATGSGTTMTATTVTWPQSQESLVTISGNYAVGDKITLTVNGVDLTYTVTAADIQGEGITEADFGRIANSIMTAYNNSVLPGHIPVSAESVTTVAGPPSSATILFTADVAGTPFTIGSETDGAGGVALDKAITLRDGQKVEFFNPISTMPVASSSPAGSATVVITPDASIERGQFVYKTVKDNATPTPNVTGMEPLRDANGNAITVKSVSGSTLTLSAAPVPTLATDELACYAPVAYRLTMQDGSMVSMSGDLFKGEAGQQFTAVTSKYEIYGSLDDEFYNSGNNLFSSNPAEFMTPPVGGGTYKPVAEMFFWGGQNIDSLVTNEVTGRSTFDSKITLTGKIKTQGDVATSADPDLVFDLDLTGTKNFATPFGVDESTQNGRSVALLNSVVIDDEGKLVGQYGDGRQFIAGQVVLVAFANVDGLVPSGANAFTSSYLSGDEVHPSVIVGRPGHKGMGGIRSGAVEGSNVDLANELVKLLIQQRMYSANSQSIRAFDDTLTTTIRMAGG
jgi:flagellar hook-basal body protein